jgi:hypothetical protein
MPPRAPFNPPPPPRRPPLPGLPPAPAFGFAPGTFPGGGPVPVGPGQPGAFPGGGGIAQPGAFPGGGGIAQPGAGFQPGLQPGIGVQPGVGNPNFPNQQTQPGSCSSIPTCDSCLQSPDRTTFVCCCDAACVSWNPQTQQGQVAGFLGCCVDYAQVCAVAAG